MAVLDKMMSVPLVPTVSPVITSFVPSVNFAAAAVPDAEADADTPVVVNVSTPLATDPTGLASGRVARTVAMPAVLITSFPVAPSAETTSLRFVFFRAVE